MSWLAFSIIVSIVLTIVLNVALRLFPGASHRMADRLDRMAERTYDRAYDESPPDAGRPRVRVYFPWKAMLIGSLLLTVAINLVLVLSR